VLVHWTLAEDIRSLKRAREAVDDGMPLPMALRTLRVWGLKERLFERLLPRLSEHDLGSLVEAASICDGLVKGLAHPDWPADAWAGLKRLALLVMQHTATVPSAARGAARPRLALQA